MYYLSTLSCRLEAEKMIELISQDVVLKTLQVVLGCF